MIALKEQIKSEIDQIVWLMESELVGALQRRMVIQLSSDRQVLAEQFSKDLKDLLDLIGTEAEKAFIKYQKLYVAESLREADDKLEQLVQKVITYLRGLGFESSFKRAYGDNYKIIFNTTHNTTVSGLNMSFNVPDLLARRIIEEGGKRVGLLDLDNGLKSKLFEIIRQARSEGKGPDEIARRIRDEIPAGPWSSTKVRADVIAKTETKYAQNMSAIANYRASGYVKSVQAFDNLIGYNDEECMARDKQVFSFDQAEVETKEEHPNGTLIWAPYTSELVSKPGDFKEIDIPGYGSLLTSGLTPEIRTVGYVHDVVMNDLRFTLTELPKGLLQDTKALVMDANRGETFMAGGQTFTTGANFNHAIKTLTIFDANNMTPYKTKVHLVHEFTHSISRYLPDKFMTAFGRATVSEGGITSYSKAWLKTSRTSGIDENLSEALSILYNKRLKGELLEVTDITHPKTMSLARVLWNALGGKE
jgi:hypothetical protein